MYDRNMTKSANSWPIGAALLQFPSILADGRTSREAGPEHWQDVMAEIAHAGFDHVDLTDTWLRFGDLDPGELDALAGNVHAAGLGVTAISVVRSSVIDPDDGLALDSVSYLRRTIDAAVVLGTRTVSAGLHRALTPDQESAEWFWLVEGATDPIGDSVVWDLAVSRLREVGEYAAERGIAISLEMYEDTYLGSAASAVNLVRDIGLANVGLNPDVGNLIRLHRPIEDWKHVLRETLPYANYWHIKNYYRDHDPRTGAYFTVPAAAESGLIDYRWALEYALATGFEGAICVEHYGGDGLTQSARNRDYLRSILEAKVRAR